MHGSVEIHARLFSVGLHAAVQELGTLKIIQSGTASTAPKYRQAIEHEAAKHADGLCEGSQAPFP